MAGWTTPQQVQELRSDTWAGRRPEPEQLQQQSHSLCATGSLQWPLWAIVGHGEGLKDQTCQCRGEGLMGPFPGPRAAGAAGGGGAGSGVESTSDYWAAVGTQLSHSHEPLVLALSDRPGQGGIHTCSLGDSLIAGQGMDCLWGKSDPGEALAGWAGGWRGPVEALAGWAGGGPGEALDGQTGAGGRGGPALLVWEGPGEALAG